MEKFRLSEVFMRKYKIDDFTEDHPSSNFPAHEELSSHSAAKVREILAKKLKIEPPPDLIDLVKTVHLRGVIIESLNADADGFDLSEAFAKADIAPPEMVLLNWYRFDEIDKMRFADLREYFWDIWYPAADDLDICAENLEWILSIVHDGVIKVVKF
jgi:hypothetical protein